MVTATLIAVWTATAVAQSAEPAVTSQPTRYDKLDNVFLACDGLINGSAPLDDADFDSLQKLGVKTIIGVDGATPDVERARSRGMRYVHVPVGYDSITEQRGRVLARAVRDLPKPVYMHCFHGKHRSPAAAAYVAVALGQRSNDDAIALLTAAGTGPNYRGLYAAVRRARVLSDDELAAADDTFPEIARVSSMVAAMCQLGRSWDHIKTIKAADWSTPEAHPDLHAVNEASMLVQRLRDLSAAPQPYNTPFPSMLQEAIRASEAFSAALERKNKADIAVRFEALEASCKACHVRFRH